LIVSYPKRFPWIYSLVKYLLMGKNQSFKVLNFAQDMGITNWVNNTASIKSAHAMSTWLFHILINYSRDVIKDEIGGKLPSGRPFRPDVRARPRLPRGWVFTVRGRGKNCVRADAGLRPRGRKKIKINKNKIK
jgi:hypothetical protein